MDRKLEKAEVETLVAELRKVQDAVSALGAGYKIHLDNLHTRLVRLETWRKNLEGEDDRRQ